MSKQIWREKALQLRKNLTKETWEAMSRQIHRKVISLKEWQRSTHVAFYHSTNNEVDTLSLITKGWQHGKIISLPKCDPHNRQLTFYKVDSFDQITKGYAGIPEPKIIGSIMTHIEQLQMIVVPGLFFDHLGYRIGYGGGYYDRFLHSIPHSIYTIGIAFSFQVTDTEFLPRDIYDQPVDILVTNEQIIDCQKKREL